MQALLPRVQGEAWVADSWNTEYWDQSHGSHQRGHQNQNTYTRFLLPPPGQWTPDSAGPNMGISKQPLLVLSCPSPYKAWLLTAEHLITTLILNVYQVACRWFKCTGSIFPQNCLVKEVLWWFPLYRWENSTLESQSLSRSHCVTGRWHLGQRTWAQGHLLAVWPD